MSFDVIETARPLEDRLPSVAIRPTTQAKCGDHERDDLPAALIHDVATGPRGLAATPKSWRRRLTVVGATLGVPATFSSVRPRVT